MKILQYYAATSLLAGAGGAKRVFCEMANALTVRGHDVYAVCNEFRTGRPFYPLDEHIHFINLNGSGRRKIKPLSWIKSFRSSLPAFSREMLEQYVEEPASKKKGEPLVKLINEIQPDAVIPYFADDYFSMLRQPTLAVPIILMHHNSPNALRQWINTPRKIAMLNMCPHLQVLQSSFVAEIQKIYHGSIHVIPNVVPQIDEKDLADLRAEKPQRTIIMISRLEPGKQQHMLIESFARLAKSYSHWKVEFYGQPSKQQYYRQLKKMIANFNLEKQIELMGSTNSPLDILRGADIFAFPSAYEEGWGLALTEAMSVGLPCVGLKTTPSVNELIVDGVNGLLSDNNSEDFAAKLKTLMDDQNRRIQLGRAGHEMMKQYAPEKIWEQWESLIETIVQESRNR